MGTGITKRSFLKSIFPTIIATTSISPILALPRIAKADGGATAMIAIQVVQVAMSLGRGSDGTGKVLGAIIMKLDRLLDGQIEMMRMMGKISEQVDDLKATIPHMLVEPEFQATYKKSYDAAQKTADLVRDIVFLKPQQIGKDEFDRLRRVYEAIDTAVNDFTIDSQRNVKGMPGLNCLLKAGATAEILANTISVFKKIDEHMPDRLKPAGWKGDQYFSRLREKLSGAVQENIIDVLSVRVAADQKEKGDEIKRKMKANPFADRALNLFPESGSPNEIISIIQNLHVRSPYQTIKTTVGVSSVPSPMLGNMDIIREVKVYDHEKIGVYNTLHTPLSIEYKKPKGMEIYLLEKMEAKRGIDGWYVVPANRTNLGISPYRAGIHNITEQKFKDASEIRGLDKGTIDAYLKEAKTNGDLYNQTVCYAEAIQQTRLGLGRVIQSLASIPLLQNPGAKPAAPAYNR